jgi:hypothetical protein
MKCVLCEVDLLPLELPQRVSLGGELYPVPALCDRCARANQTRPGSPEALQRLVTGEIDPDEAARVKVATLLPWETP